MDKVAVKTALRELGDVSAARVAVFVEQQFGVEIEPRFIPLYIATIRDRSDWKKSGSRQRWLPREPWRNKRLDRHSELVRAKLVGQHAESQCRRLKPAAT